MALPVKNFTTGLAQTVTTLDDLDKGAGTGGTASLRVLIDSSQIDPSVPAGSPNSGAPSLVGSVSTTSLAAQTPNANGQRANTYSDADGPLLVRSDVPLEDILSAVVTSTSGANVSGIAAQGAGVKIYIEQVLVANMGGAANGYVAVTDGSGGTTKIAAPYSTAGATVSLKKPVAFTANTAVFVDPSGTDTCVITLIGFKSKV